MVKKQLAEDLKKAVQSLGYQATDIVVYIPENPRFGDYSTNVALQLAKQKLEKDKQSSMEIAKKIVGAIHESPEKGRILMRPYEKIEIKEPGFINFFIKAEILKKGLLEILSQGKSYGQNQLGKGQKVQVEFVSANPTGPLTLANGRGGALGDTLASVLSFSEYQVEREYYINDTGNQVRSLGESVLAVAGKTSAKKDDGVPAAEDNLYHGEYVKELAEIFKNNLDQDPQALGHLLADYLMEHDIKPALLRFGINFDDFFSERSIYQAGLIEKTLDLLKKAGVTYEKEGAVWLETTKFGDEKDRVILTSEEKRGKQEPTYLLPDIAYHSLVFQEGFDKKINIWGADHHGYVERLKAGVAAAGYPDRVVVILIQMAKLIKEGKEVKMSKRAGTFVTLDELLDEIGKDAARFFFLMYSPDSAINLNLDLAKEQSNKNPVYYVQYAYARMSNIIKKVKGSQNEDIKPDQLDVGLLDKKEELELIKHLGQFPNLIEDIVKSYQVHYLTGFAIKLADLFHQFYEVSPVLQAKNEDLKQARLSLVLGSKIVLGSVLGLLGVSAPERM